MWFLVLDVLLLVPIVGLAISTDESVHLSYLTVSFIALRWTASNGLNIWFWYHGIDIPNALQCMEPRVFMYANLGAYGNVRTAFKFFATSSGVFSVLWILFGFVPGVYDRLFKR